QIEPRSSTDYNEIGDACENVPCSMLNGVSVQSYWSYIDNACVIPTNMPITSWRITCVRKKHGTKLNPNQNIDIVAGVHVPTGQKFWMKQKDVIARIDSGDEFFVMAPSGVKAQVKVFIHFPPWNPKGSRYIATVPDNIKENNLLALPECTSADL